MSEDQDDRQTVIFDPTESSIPPPPPRHHSLPPPPPIHSDLPLPPPSPPAPEFPVQTDVYIPASSLLGDWGDTEDLTNEEHVHRAQDRFCWINNYRLLPTNATHYGMHTKLYVLRVIELSRILSPDQCHDFTKDSLRDLGTLSVDEYGETIMNVTTAFSIVLKHTVNLRSNDKNLLSMYTFSESDFPQGAFEPDKLAALQDLTTLLHRASHWLNSPGVPIGTPCTCLLFHERRDLGYMVASFDDIHA